LSRCRRRRRRRCRINFRNWCRNVIRRTWMFDEWRRTAAAEATPVGDNRQPVGRPGVILTTCKSWSATACQQAPIQFLLPPTCFSYAISSFCPDRPNIWSSSSSFSSITGCQCINNTAISVLWPLKYCYITIMFHLEYLCSRKSIVNKMRVPSESSSTTTSQFYVHLLNV